jgi:hypothetical protein
MSTKPKNLSLKAPLPQEIMNELKQSYARGI